MQAEPSAEAPVAVPSPPRKISPVGIAGLVIALLALAAAVLSPWGLEALDSEQKPLDQVAVEFAGKVKDRLVAQAKGQEFVAPAAPQHTDWPKWYIIGVISSGVLAIIIGVLGLVARHDTRLNGATITVAASAIIFQYALILAAALLVILLIVVVLSLITGGI